MKISLDNIQVVIIDSPIHLMNESFVTDLLGRSFKMKYEGYTATYDDTVLPFDKTDFVGTHIMLCDTTSGVYTPIFSYKSITLDRCQKYRIEFPALSLMKAEGNPDCIHSIHKIMENVTTPSTLSYDSAWAQNVKYRFSHDPALKQILREFMTMIIVGHHQDYNIPHMICTGMVKVKTDQFFVDIGMNKLHRNSHFQYTYSTKEDAHIFYDTKFSDKAYKMKEKHNDLWSNRLFISIGNEELKKVA